MAGEGKAAMAQTAALCCRTSTRTRRASGIADTWFAESWVDLVFLTADPARTVLVFANVFHPVNYLSVELFLNRDVGHAGCWRRSMPVFLAGREPDHITRTDLLNCTAFALHPAATSGDDESLPERVSMPGCARARLKRYTCARHKRGIGRLEERINPHRPGEPLRGSL